jgi:hypothetical protein
MRVKFLVAAVLLAFHGCEPAYPAAPPILPDPKLTPGDVLTNVTVEQICQRGYANVLGGGARNVPESEKRQVFIEYFGAMPSNPGEFEIDHCDSIELGGSNRRENLWPQSYHGKWNARVKDRLEDWMYASLRHDLAAHGHDSATALLHQYQTEIAANWTNAYKKYIGPSP